MVVSPTLAIPRDPTSRRGTLPKTKRSARNSWRHCRLIKAATTTVEDDTDTPTVPEPGLVDPSQAVRPESVSNLDFSKICVLRGGYLSLQIRV